VHVGQIKRLFITLAPKFIDMKRIFTTLAVICLALTINAQMKYIHCGTLIDVETKEALKERTIIIEGNKIQEVKKGYVSAPLDTEVIDLKDMTVMPGFMDMHVHIEHESRPKRYEEKFRLEDTDVALEATVYCRRTLEAGFTTVRDLGGFWSKCIT
jgi:imidazolonepropionase-like amidohydrolase